MNNKISIIIPVYNASKTIGETLDAVINQIYKNIEVIIIDDGSKDDIDSVVNQYIEKYNFIRFFKQDNQGQVRTRNNGVEKSTGHYLLFLDADDIILPTYIEKCVKILDENPDVKLVYSRVNFFGKRNEELKLKPYTFKMLLRRNVIYISALIRKEDFCKYGPFDTELKCFEDWDLWISILKHGGEVVKIPEILFYYRKHEDNISISDHVDSDKNYETEVATKIYFKHYETYSKYYGTIPEMINKVYKYDRSIQEWYVKLFYFLKGRKSNKL